MNDIVIKRNDANGTHNCILGAILGETTGPVLELGVGHFSTPLIYYMCKDRFCISIENDIEWYKFFRDEFSSRLHYFCHAKKDVSDELSRILQTEEFKNIFWDVVFVDQAPAGDRVKCVEILRNKARYIICHDTEPTVPKDYNWQNIWNTFKYKYYWNYFGINGTTVMSDFSEIPLRKNYRNVSKKKDEGIKGGNVINIPKIDIDEWISGEKIEDFCDIDTEKNDNYEQAIKDSNGRVLTVWIQTHKLYKVIPFLAECKDKKFIVVSGNSDGGIKYNASRWDSYSWKNENNIVHWFMQNCDVKEPNVTPIPIGLENLYVFKRDVKQELMVDLVNANIPKENKVYLCFRRGTNSEQRNSAYKAFSGLSWATCEEGENGTQNIKPYFNQMIKHQFILSPDGNGMDTVRTWEALYMGAIPIVKRHVFSEYFAKYLPIIIIDSYEEVTQDMLINSMKDRTFNYDMLNVSYWGKEIRKAKGALCG